MITPMGLEPAFGVEKFVHQNSIECNTITGRTNRRRVQKVCHPLGLASAYPCISPARNGVKVKM